MKSHASEVKSIGCYLKGTRDKGLILKPDKLSSFECWVDSDFASISRAGWVIQFAGCPLTWASKMQTITTLSTTKTEYVAFSMSLGEVIPLTVLLKEIKQQGFEVQIDPPNHSLQSF